MCLLCNLLLGWLVGHRRCAGGGARVGVLLLRTCVKVVGLW